MLERSIFNFQFFLLLHGALGSSSQLQPLADTLADKFQSHSLNLSGHGGQPFSPKGFSIPVFADKVLQYIEENNLAPINIFGYSMGGYVAMYLAKHHPEAVNKIITLATKFHWDEETAAKEVKMLDPDKLMQKVPAFAEELERRHEPNDWKLLLEKTREMLVGLGKQNALKLEDYKTINTPCLLLLGDKDKMVTVEETVAVANALPNGRFQLLADTLHPIEKVDTGMLTDIMEEFFNR